MTKTRIKKNKTTYLIAALFALFFTGLITLFALGLKKDPNALDLATKNSKIPAFYLPSLLDKSTLTNADLTTEKPYYLINVWGSWCQLCYKEHPYLKELSRTETIYGVNWKDERLSAKFFISKGGNPYKAIIVDDDSILSIGLGVYGAPETFLIKTDGTILHRYAGAIDKAVWQAQFVPKINALGKK